MSSEEKCDRCGILGHDRRTLWMACFYEMSELGVPFEKVGIHGCVMAIDARFQSGRRPDSDELEKATGRTFYTLRVCKGCRSEWMGAIKTWFRAQPGDASRWNNDASTPGDDQLPSLVAEAETLKSNLIALQQRLDAVLELGRVAVDQREQSRPAGDVVISNDGFIGIDEETGADVVTCWDCGGDGEVLEATSDDPDDDEVVACPACGGTGTMRVEPEVSK